MSEKQPKSLKQLINDLPNYLKILIILGATIAVLVITYTASENAEDNTEFNLFTLSSEQLEGKTYTERTTYDDSDMWETNYTDNKKTEISITETSISENIISFVEFPIDINLANSDELMQINGIGTITAENIINYRNKYGYFYSYNELLNIEGIGEKKLSNLLDYIYISEEFLEETTVSTTAAPKEAVTTMLSTTIKETSVTETVTVTAETTEDFEIINEEFIFDDNEYEEKDDSIDDNDFSITTTEKEHYVSFPIELNSASIEDLVCIDGIGEATANKIVSYANNYGFYSVDDLLNVDGIGTSKLEAIRQYVYVNSSTLPQKSETDFTNIFEPETEIQTETTYEFITETTTQNIPRINVNTCTMQDLMQLPGIDATIANNIIMFRDAIGGFYKIEEVGLADGMTNAKLSAILDYIYI